MSQHGRNREKKETKNKTKPVNIWEWVKESSLWTGPGCSLDIGCCHHFSISQVQCEHTAKQINLNAFPNNIFSLLAADTWTRGCLDWKKKGSAEALLDLQTFLTSGVSSLTLSCLSKTNAHLKQHPSVLVEQWQIAFLLQSKHLDLFSTPPLLFMVNSLNNSWAMGFYKLINCLFGATAMPHIQPSAS